MLTSPDLRNNRGMKSDTQYLMAIVFIGLIVLPVVALGVLVGARRLITRERRGSCIHLKPKNDG